ncbi:hypothetical protein TNCV_1582791 [Trichonephila clavipes]|nr:hypothetical protein TNCV_1582791 [Trichonephila clavipes]
MTDIASVKFWVLLKTYVNGLLYVKSGSVRKFGEWGVARMSSSSSDRGSKLQIPSSTNLMLITHQVLCFIQCPSSPEDEQEKQGQVFSLCSKLFKNAVEDRKKEFDELVNDLDLLEATEVDDADFEFTCRNCGGGDRGRVAIYRPFGEIHRT